MPKTPDNRIQTKDLSQIKVTQSNFKGVEAQEIINDVSGLYDAMLRSSQGCSTLEENEDMDNFLNHLVQNNISGFYISDTGFDGDPQVTVEKTKIVRQRGENSTSADRTAPQK